MNTNDKKHIVVADMHWIGHHMSYLKIFARIFLDMGYKVTVLSARPAEMWDWGKSLPEDLQADFFTSEIEYPKPVELPIRKLLGFLYRLKLWLTFTKAINTANSRSGWTKPDFVYLAWLDDMVQPVPKFMHWLFLLVFRYNWGGLYFHPRVPYMPKVDGAGGLFRGTYEDVLRLPTCKLVTTLDESMVDMLKRKVRGAEVIALPDVAMATNVPDKLPEVVKHVKKLAGKRKLVGLIGSLDKRKGFVTLLDVAELAKERDDLFFVIAGKFNPVFEVEEYQHIVEVMAKYPSNCYFHFDYMSDAEFDGLFNELDVVFAAYINFPSSSNMLIKAAQLEKPLIVSKGYVMGQRVAKFGIGEVVPQENPQACLQAIDKILQTDKSDFLANFAHYRETHSLSEMYRILDESISKILT